MSDNVLHLSKERTQAIQQLRDALGRIEAGEDVGFALIVEQEHVGVRFAVYNIDNVRLAGLSSILSNIAAGYTHG